MTATPLGVHLIGSVCGAPTAEAAFRKCCSSFPNRLRRVPDGEPANRAFFIRWQQDVFKHTPAVLRQYDSTFTSIALPEVPASEIEEIVKNVPPLQPGYAAATLESYEVFKQLRDEGVIPKGVRFQVSIPTPLAIMALIRDGFQLAVESYYEKALLDEVKEMQDKIPHQDLAIQWDVANEICMLEGAYKPHFFPYFDPVFEGCIERIARILEAVDPDVELGFHLCYGDMGNKHFVEPKDTGLLAKISGGILEEVGRKVNWIHLPAPKNRDDVGYFKPLGGIDLGETELYLGLVHADDEGTNLRIKAARETVQKFGVANECGLGRTPPENFESISKIATAISSPVI